MGKRGFTLIELLVVISVIGIIAAIVLVNVRAAAEKARFNSAKSFEASVRHAVGAYLAGEWSFDNNTNPASTPDTSGNNNNGAVAGGAAYQTEASGNCIRGGCFYFDGIDDRITAPASPIFSTQKFTLSAWIKPDIPSNGSFGTFLANGFHGWQLRFDASQPLLSARIIDALPPGNDTLQDTLLQPNIGNKWHYIAATYDGTNLALFVDGALRESVRKSDVPGFGTVFYDNQTLRIGYYQAVATYYFQGLVDEVRVYDEGLPTNFLDSP